MEHLESTPDPGPIGVSLEVDDSGRHRDEAAELEELGYGALWIAGGQLDRLERVAEVIRATRRVPVATSIIPTGVYGSDEVTALYRELEAQHPGRFLVGLGAAHDAPRPGVALGAYLDRLDAADPPVPAGRRILAALGPRRLALARDRFAGAVPLLITPARTADARRILGPDRLLAVDQPVVLDDDPERARAAGRGLLGFLLQVPGYPENFRRMGFSDTDIDAVSDRMVDAVVARGGPDEIVERVAAHHAAGADHVSVTGLGPDGTPTGVDAARILAGRLLTPR